MKAIACRSALALLGAVALTAQATPVSIASPFINLENRGINSLGYSAGQFFRIGATSVTPNGSAGTWGVGTHVLPDGTVLNFNIPFAPSPVIPNFYSRLLNDSPDRRGAWTLTFGNGTDRAAANVSLDAQAAQAPFVNSITLSGTSSAPTFTWTPPPGTQVDKYRINILDKALAAAGQGANIVSRDLLPSQTSYTVNPADFTVPGYAFTLGKAYVIEIGLIQTKDGTSNSNNANVQAISRYYADFTPVQAGGPVVNLPVVLANGSYVFNMTVTAGQTYYIDPMVAVGYDYAIGHGDPNFASVDLPDAIGDGLYDIWLFDDANLPVLFQHDWDGHQVLNFGPGGVSRFRVTGIETSAGLDPGNTTAFVTGLTFSGSGHFTGTQTPLTTDRGDVPEPSMALLVLTALASLGLSRRNRR